MYSIYTILHASRISSLLPDSFAAATLLQLARHCGFARRLPRKLDPRTFLLSCIALAASGGSGLRHQAILVGVSRGITLSKQALHKRLGQSSLSFLRACLARAIASRARLPMRLPGLGRILIQDSTCVTLPGRFAQLFPGPSNQLSKHQACLRIQCIYDLCAEQFVHFGLWPFTRNDQAAASDPLDILAPGDLLLRDLGYFCLAPIASIATSGAYFLSKLRMGTLLLDPATGRTLALQKLLSLDRPTEIHVLLGARQRLPVRLLAIPLTPALAASRRRKAKADRDKRLNHSKAYLKLLGWHIMVTNTPQQILTARKAAELYKMRWRVEILFKSWKGFLGLQCPPRSGIHHALAAIYGSLILATLVHLCLPDHQASTNLSLLRICQLVANWVLPTLILDPLHSCQKRWLDQIQYHCLYDKRYRSNYSDFRTSSLS